MENLNMINKKHHNEENNKIDNNLKNIKNIYIVMSGKGGVGKSTISSMIASYLLIHGNKVGILDCDFHGPSIPFLFGLKNNKLEILDDTNKILPIEPINNLKIMSINFLLENEDQPIIWRSPMKNSAIRQFLEDVEWKDLDYLIIDLPPGTGDEILNIVQLIKRIDGAIVVTIPQDMALLSVRKSLSFINKINVKLIGIVENMSYVLCPNCNKKIVIFPSNDTKKASSDFDTEIIANIPLNIKFSDINKNKTIIDILKTEKELSNSIEPIIDKIENIYNKKINN